jgi:hypothetical protein
MKEHDKSRMFRTWKTINPICVFGLLALIAASPVIGQNEKMPPQDESRPQRSEASGARTVMMENRTPISPNPGQTVGLFLNTPKAFKGYTLFAPKHNNIIYLIDNEGRIVNQWKSAYEPGQSVHLKPNGNLLHCCFTKNKGFTSGGEGGRVEEFDWNGNLIWEFDYSNDQHLSHHDIAPLPNGNILMLVVEKKSYEESLAAGFNPEMLRDRQLFPDSIIEVEPTYPKGGKIVWEWRVWDHLIQNSDKDKPNYGDISVHPELIDVACNGRPVPAFWNHMNSIAYNPKLDQIVLSVRGCNEIWFIDHREIRGHTLAIDFNAVSTFFRAMFISISLRNPGSHSCY